MFLYLVYIAAPNSPLRKLGDWYILILLFCVDIGFVIKNMMYVDLILNYSNLLLNFSETYQITYCFSDCIGDQ